MAIRDLAVLGKSHEKKDSLLKVTGKAAFAADLKFENMLYGGVFRSTVPHAAIKSFDPSKALALPGVACVLTSGDIPGGNRIGIIIKDEPVLVDDKVRRIGDAIAIVAAETPELVEEALTLIKVEYDLLEPILSYEDAIREDSAKVHGDNNLYISKHLETGDVGAAFATCDVIVEGTYTTPMLSHMFIEPDAGVSRIENDIMTIYASTQNPHFDRGEVARMLGIPNNKVRVIQMATGGGFGGKLDISVQCHLALLTRVGTVIATGQKLEESVGFIETLKQAKAKAAEVLHPDKEKNQALGVGCMWYGVGNTGLPNPSAAFVEVLPDCSVNLMVGCADIGQGSTTVMATIAAEELGLNYEDIQVIAADTMVTPEGGATSASRQTFISGNATWIACKQAKDTLAKTAADFLHVPPEDLVFRSREIYSSKDPAVKMSYPELMGEMKKWGKLAVGAGAYNPKTTYLDAKTMAGTPYEVYSYATTIAQAEVDTGTGEIHVQKVVSAHDVGQAVDRTMVEGQIEGGTAMALGFTVFEKIEYENGKIKNPIFSKYLIPTAMDVPEIYPIIVECPGEAGPFGAKGVGEPALIPGIPAITAAVENVLGKRFFELPMAPKEVLKKIQEPDA